MDLSKRIETGTLLAYGLLLICAGGFMTFFPDVFMSMVSFLLLCFFGISGGKMVQTFDTDCAKIGILICYDVEFPELSRIMADQGMQILFVPFLTDTQNGYSRVRVCAQARAIENECFVVIAGSVGNLPRVHNMDIQYAQSGVFTPCDFAFPTDGKRAEATPNTEMILVSDVDLNLLNELHTYGSVRNLRDRRHDLYELKVKK